MPDVVPALQQWTGGVGEVRLAADLRISVSPDDASALRVAADQLCADLKDLTGWTVSTVVASEPQPRDIALELDAAADVGPTAVAAAEGYRLDTTDGVHITSRTPTGVFWGTRSLLQMLVRQNPGEVTLPVGLNDNAFGGPGGDWSKAQSAFRLAGLGLNGATPTISTSANPGPHSS
ncbi:glycoside hydrolase family 20 zincin-like fold domain-containing protein [Kribbella sp. NPDC051936]|uniref:glycoside hydrolase family 20 zincin-like fold domain-containing protein n=1 Tax=Kribbella sp. NPDC051936 TaxID=3154946 RepID=UPI00342E36CD